MSALSENTVTAQDEVADLLADLIGINTSNPTHAERPAAEWVAEKLDEVGIESQIIEAAPGRASTIARIEGSELSRKPLLIHGHLDVVPADPAEWSVDPFAGEVRDGYVWGRGAIDMKDMDAMTLALVREWARTGRKPPRDVVLAFVADEEAGGRLGAHHLVDHHPELFADCTEAISEVGGFSVSLDDQTRLYLIQTAEKGINWLRLKAKGAPGHGSMGHRDNSGTRLAAAGTPIGAPEGALVITRTPRAPGEGPPPPPRRGGHPHRRPRVAAGHHRHRAGHGEGTRRRHRARSRSRGRRRVAAAVGWRGPHDRGDRPQHHQPDDARGRLQGERHSRQG